MHCTDRSEGHAARWRYLGQRLSALVVAGAALFGAALSAQAQVIAMPDSTNNRLVLFSAQDGSVVNSNFFALAGGTPVHALEVGNEIWVSEQIGDRVSRWSATGSFLGQIGGLDNVRGMGLINGTVYVTNAGTANGAPGAAVVMYDTTGASLGSFGTATTAPSPFGVLAYQGGLLVSSSSANDDIHRYTLTGGSLGTFYNGAALNFGEQMAYALNGDILVAGFTSDNILRFNAGGAIVANYTAAGARGVVQLANGNLLWSNGSGAHVLDIGTGASAQVYAGSGRYMQAMGVVPEPGAWALMLTGLALVGVQAQRRRGRSAAA